MSSYCLLGSLADCIYTNVKSIYALRWLGLHQPEVMGSDRVHSSPFSGSGNPVIAFWVGIQHPITLVKERPSIYAIILVDIHREVYNFSF